MALIEKDDLRKILPQKSRMALIDRVISADKEEKSVVCESVITKDNLFYDEAEKGVPTFVSFEMMAQSIAAANAVLDSDNAQKSGMILSVNDFESFVPFLRSDDTILIFAKEDFASSPIFRYDCAVKKGDEILASAKITVMQSDFNVERLKN